MTRRERLERKAEKRREWARGRQQKADTLNTLPEYAHDWAFITQPGHIPARARIIARQDRAFENQKMADHHEAKADSLENQLEKTIFSDDPDALGAIEARIAELEAKQERMKAANVVVRKFKKDPQGGCVALEQLGFTASNAKRLFEPDYAGRFGFPSYALTNNSGNIRRLRERIKTVRAQQERTKEAEAAPHGVTFQASSGYCAVTFAEKPDRATLEALRAANFSWGRGSWSGYVDNLPECVRVLLPVRSLTV